jgi:hypothetical protein
LVLTKRAALCLKERRIHSRLICLLYALESANTDEASRIVPVRGRVFLSDNGVSQSVTNRLHAREGFCFARELARYNEASTMYNAEQKAISEIAERLRETGISEDLINKAFIGYL